MAELCSHLHPTFLACAHTLQVAFFVEVREGSADVGQAGSVLGSFLFGRELRGGVCCIGRGGREGVSELFDDAWVGDGVNEGVNQLTSNKKNAHYTQCS